MWPSVSFLCSYEPSFNVTPAASICDTRSSLWIFLLNVWPVRYMSKDLILGSCVDLYNFPMLISGNFTKSKVTAIPLHAWTCYYGCSSLRVTEFLDSRRTKVASLSAVRIGRLDPQEIYLVLFSVSFWVDPQNRNAAGRNKSLKNPSDSIGKSIPRPSGS